MEQLVPLGISWVLIGALIAVGFILAGILTPIWVLLVFTAPGLLATFVGAASSRWDA